MVAEVLRTVPDSATREDALRRFGVALADPLRQRILLALLEGPAYPSELVRALGTTPSNLSNHLACLRGCGLVVAEREGRRIRYELSDPRLRHALQDLAEVVLAIDSRHPHREAHR